MAHPQRTDERLVDRARSGDRWAQQELWRAHRRWVAAIILAHRPRAVEVDDLMQDVAIRFVSRLDTLRDAGAFRPWLRQIVINICRGAARSCRPTLRLGDETRDDEPGGDGRSVAPQHAVIDTPHQISARQDAAERLFQQALTLPPEYREPLLLRCIQCLSYQQIGELLGLPVTTIETRLARARRMLREEIGDEIAIEGVP